MHTDAHDVSSDTPSHCQINRLNFRTVGTFLVHTVTMIVALKFFFPFLSFFGFWFHEVADKIGTFRWGFFTLYLGEVLLITSAQTIFLIFTFLFFYKIENIRLKDFGFSWSLGQGGWKKSLWFNIKVVLVLFLLLVLILNISSYFFDKEIVRNFVSYFQEVYGIKRMRFNISPSPFFEEIIFRGIYCTLLARYGFKWRYTILITGILFGLIHIGNHHPNITVHVLHVIWATVIGWFLGWIYYHTRTLAMPVAWHYLVNIFVSFLSLSPNTLAKISSFLII